MLVPKHLSSHIDLGWRFVLHSEKRKFDVTEKALLLCSVDGVLHVSGQYNLAKLFSLSLSSNTKGVLEIKNQHLKNWRKLYIADGIPFSVYLGRERPEWRAQHLHIVYFINSKMNSNFQYLLGAQLKSLKQAGVLKRKHTQLHLVCLGTDVQRAIAEKTVRRFFSEAGQFEIECYDENTFEYRGIQKVRNISIAEPNSLILYFHAKGISHIKLGKFFRNRQTLEKYIFERVVGEWEANVHWLQRIESADKLGIYCGGWGWMWYNFWWAKGVYLSRLDIPLRTDRRHYYEDWLGRLPIPGQAVDKVDEVGDYQNTVANCLNLVFDVAHGKYNIGSSVHPDDNDISYGLTLPLLDRMLDKLFRR